VGAAGGSGHGFVVVIRVGYDKVIIWVGIGVIRDDVGKETDSHVNRQTVEIDVGLGFPLTVVGRYHVRESIIVNHIV
jgi:hypothetical protein